MSEDISDGHASGEVLLAFSGERLGMLLVSSAAQDAPPHLSAPTCTALSGDLLSGRSRSTLRFYDRALNSRTTEIHKRSFYHMCLKRKVGSYLHN